MLTGLGGATVAAATATPAAAQDGGPDYGDWFSDVSNYEGTVDYTGQSSVTVEVGVEANGGPYGFGPAAVRVDPGTTVTFEWVSDSHNVVPESVPDGASWEGNSSIQNTGATYEHTFETEGIYTYFCEPHLSLGMKGAVVVGGSGGIAPSEAGGGSTETPSGDTTPGGGEGGGGSSGGVGSSLTGEAMVFVLSAVAAVLSPLVLAVLFFFREPEQRPPEPESR